MEISNSGQINGFSRRQAEMGFRSLGTKYRPAFARTVYHLFPGSGTQNTAFAIFWVVFSVSRTTRLSLRKKRIIAVFWKCWRSMLWMVRYALLLEIRLLSFQTHWSNEFRLYLWINKRVEISNSGEIRSYSRRQARENFEDLGDVVWREHGPSSYRTPPLGWGGPSQKFGT